MKQGYLESFARSVIGTVVSAPAFQELCTLQCANTSELLDRLARHIAESYCAGNWSFEDADGAMNHLWAFLSFQKDCEIPPYFYSVYDAFDAGEYYHSGDSRDASPEQLYTKPLIAKIVSSP